MTGTVVHVLNRAVNRDRLFSDEHDYRAFLDIFAEARKRIPLRVLAFCVMPNHWHLVVWPAEDGQVSVFLHLLTLTHASRWRVARGTLGHGAVYQGRFKSFPVQSDDHVARVCRYVERTPLRAGLVQRAEEWPWGSLCHRLQGDPAGLLDAGPVEIPAERTIPAPARRGNCGPRWAISPAMPRGPRHAACRRTRNWSTLGPAMRRRR